MRQGVTVMVFLLACTTWMSYSAEPASSPLPEASSVERLPAPSRKIGPIGHRHYDHLNRANSACDGEALILPYLSRVEQAVEHVGETVRIPNGFVPWWQKRVYGTTRRVRSPIPVDIAWLVHSAMRNSPRIRMLSTEPHIRRSMLLEEQAGFDWFAFLDSTYDDLNDPVGNILTTGNNDDRFKDQIWNANGGIRRRTEKGGELEITQRLGHQANNSTFLLPNPQGTTRMELSFTQPLLNGAGYAYNQSQIYLARISVNSTRDNVVGEIQDHLLEVTQAYWDMYRARAEYFQRSRLLHDAIRILNNLEGRQDVDSLQRQVLRAKAAVANRKSEIARAQTSIRNAESQLRLLVNDPDLRNTSGQELLPKESPLVDSFPISIRDSLTTALRYRPDISQAIRQIRSTTVQMGVAKNEILPKLDFVVSTYVAGLDGEDSRVFSAFRNQFRDGRPGFSVGLQFEVPLGNRAPRARMQRRYWELQRALYQFRTTVEESLTEVELSVREVETSHREMYGKFQSMVAADNETAYLLDRWQTLPDENDSATQLLEDLLDAQERRTDEESSFVRAQVNYALSVIRLRKAMGTLLRCDTNTGNDNLSSTARRKPDLSHTPWRIRSDANVTPVEGFSVSSTRSADNLQPLRIRVVSRPNIRR